MKNRRLIIKALILVVTIAVAGVVSVNVFSQDSKTPIGSIDNKAFYSDTDSSVMIYEQMGSSVSPIDVKKKAISNELIKREVERLGWQASSEELAQTLKDVREGYELNDETRAIYKKALEVNKMTEEEYWEAVTPIFNNALNRGLYKARLEEEFNLAHSKTMEPYELKDAFDEYYEETVANLFTKYNVQIFDD
jgi:hypothetical protein